MKNPEDEGRRKSSHFKINIKRASKSFSKLPSDIVKLVEALKTQDKDEDIYKRNVKSTLCQFFSKNKSLRRKNTKSSNLQSYSNSLSDIRKSAKTLRNNVILSKTNPLIVKVQQFR